MEDWRYEALQRQHKLSIEVNAIRQLAYESKDYETRDKAEALGEKLCQLYLVLKHHRIGRPAAQVILDTTERAIKNLRNKQTNQPNEQED